MRFNFTREAEDYKTFKIRCANSDKDKVLTNLDSIRANNGGKDIMQTYQCDGPTIFEFWVDTKFSKHQVETRLGDGVVNPESFTVTYAR